MSNKNRFYTLMIVPEKTSKVRRLVIPHWVAKGAIVGFVFGCAILAIMLLDYSFVMNQITENNELRLENYRLRQQVQIFNNKMSTMENTLERIETFATRLKVITNLEDKESFTKRIDTETQPLPDAISNVGKPEKPTEPLASQPEESDDPTIKTRFGANASEKDPEVIRLKKEARELEERFISLNHASLQTEQNLQDLYELLADQRLFLLALPTRKPAVGYFTSGFGVRKSPYGGGEEKMHEGLDIANHPGTKIQATANGIVSFAGQKPGYGRTVVIDHGFGIETWYGHSQSLLVKAGQKVKRGQKVSTIGSTGRSTGPHVHYEVRVHGIPVDPLSYILED